MIFMLL